MDNIITEEKQLSCNLAAIRETEGVSQSGLALKFGWLKETVENWENGSVKIPDAAQEKLSEFFNRAPEAFYGGLASSQTFDKVVENLQKLSDSAPKEFAMAVVAVETGIKDKLKLEEMFQNWMEKDEINLVSDEWYERLQEDRFLKKEENLDLNQGLSR